MTTQDRAQVYLGIRDTISELMNVSRSEQERLLLQRAINMVAAAEYTTQ